MPKKNSKPAPKKNYSTEEILANKLKEVELIVKLSNEKISKVKLEKLLEKLRLALALDSI